MAKNEERYNFERLDVLHCMPYIDFSFPTPDLATQRLCIQVLMNRCDDPEVPSRTHV